MQETKSNWDIVTHELRAASPVHLGRYASYWMRKTPRRMLHCLSYYKFAAKMIGQNKHVLDIGCNEGLGTYLLKKECGDATGIDFEEAAIQAAEKNFTNDNIPFLSDDFFSHSFTETYDAAVNFDVIEHILPEKAPLFFTKAASLLKKNGVFVVGTPSKISQEYASDVSKQGHINIYSHERLIEELEIHFQHVFLFSAHDEVVHTGFYPLAHYFIAVCTGVL